MSTNIKEIKALEILDSRGNPTVRTKVILEDNSEGIASVPSGASTGELEAVELRDGDDRYLEKGVQKACNNIKTTIQEEVQGFDASDQKALDEKMIELDGTENKANLGANAILGVSLAAAKAVANSKDIPLYKHIQDLSDTAELEFPRPMMNIVNGGKHADSGLEFQEFMIVPKQTEMSEMVRMGSEVFHHLKKLLSKKGESVAVGDEGRFAPRLKSNKEALEVIIEAINNAGYLPGADMEIALDVAAVSFYNKENNTYTIRGEEKTAEDMLTIYHQLLAEFPIFSIEDPFDENDWDGFKKMQETLGNEVQIVGDDLFVTNPEILKRGIEEKAANAILIKVNQIGTLSETLEAIQMAKDANFKTIISHRSGETEDTFISDLAYGTAAGQLKTGSLSRSERTAKYNRLLEIEANF